MPFNVVFGWSGTWDNLPAAHAAAIAFDLLTMWGCSCSAGRSAGRRSASCWRICGRPIRSLCSRWSSNTNDALVSLADRARAAGAQVGTGPRGDGRAGRLDQVRAAGAGAAVPARGRIPPPGRRQAASYVVAYGLTLRGDDGLRDRDGKSECRSGTTRSPTRRPPGPVLDLGPVGQLPARSLGLEQHIVEGAVVALAVAAMFVPRRRGLGQTAALGAAVMIAFQLWPDLLVLPLHRLVLPAGDRGAGR